VIGLTIQHITTPVVLRWGFTSGLALGWTQNDIKLYYLDLILHLQGQVSQYLASQHFHMDFTFGGMWIFMWVAYLTLITNV
jgi:hypothetical protein